MELTSKFFYFNQSLEFFISLGLIQKSFNQDILKSVGNDYYSKGIELYYINPRYIEDEEV